MAPNKVDNDQQILKTPENPKRGRARKKSSSFEKSFIRKIDFNDPVINTKHGNQMWESFPDLAENQENKTTVGLAEVDMEVFTKHRTVANEGARIVRTEAGAFIACASSINNQDSVTCTNLQPPRSASARAVPGLSFQKATLKQKL